MADAPKRKPVDNSTHTRHPDQPREPSGKPRRPLRLSPSTPFKLVKGATGAAIGVVKRGVGRL